MGMVYTHTTELCLWAEMMQVSPGVSVSVAAGVLDAPGVLLGSMDVVGGTVDVAVGVVL